MTDRGRSRLVRRGSWVLLVVVVVAALIAGTRPDGEPASAADRAHELKTSTLCPVCDGQNVLESNAPIARAIRSQIDEAIAAGRSDGEIRAFLARQYGDDVNPLPPSSGVGGLVWVVPVAAAVAGLFAVVLAVRRWAPAGEGTGAFGWLEGRGRPVTVAVIALVAVGAGVLVASTAGLRLPGQSVSGDIALGPTDLVRQAEQAMFVGDYARAVEVADDVLADDPANVDALVVKGQALRLDGEVLSALQAFDAALAIDPEDADAHAQRGWLLVQVPDATLQAQGLASLDRAVELDPTAFDSWVFRGFGYRTVGTDLAEAITSYETALTLDPPPAMRTQLESAIGEMRDELANP
jgi:cytochrome c-type biogenesis protein CcmH